MVMCPETQRNRSYSEPLHHLESKLRNIHLVILHLLYEYRVFISTWSGVKKAPIPK